VLNNDDHEVRGWSSLAQGECLSPLPVEDLPPLLVAGEHNRRNAACAAAAAIGIGCSQTAIERGLTSFQGLPQRLELVAEVDGRRFFSDSQATTPESTIAALHAVRGPCWLLAGGADKGSRFEPLAATIAQKACGAAFYGTVRDVMAAALRAESLNLRHTAIESMAEAFAWCWSNSQSGDAILLSPGCASLDQFRDWAHRGDCFVELVRGVNGLQNANRTST
jgi:UDP-N-acetylmuramoylalanine--D-glutamate ligase